MAKKERERVREREPDRLYSPSPSISNPQWKRAREMVADIGHRYISEGAKGSALEHKKIGSPYSKRQATHSPPSPSATGVHNHPPIYGAFCTFDIFYCRSPLFVLFMFLLGTTLGHPPTQGTSPFLPWLGRRPPLLPAKYRVHSRAKFTPYGYGRSGPATGYSQGFARDAKRRYIKTIYFREA